MSSEKLRNIDRFIDRHGKPRHYYRRDDGVRVPLPGEPGSYEFMTRYWVAVADAALSCASQAMERLIELNASEDQAPEEGGTP